MAIFYLYSAELLTVTGCRGLKAERGPNIPSILSITTPSHNCLDMLASLSAEHLRGDPAASFWPNLTVYDSDSHSAPLTSHKTPSDLLRLTRFRGERMDF